MDPTSIGLAVTLGGGFSLGVWYIFSRPDVSVSMRQGMTAEGLQYADDTPSFGNAKQEIDRKLAIVERRRRRQQALQERIAVDDADRYARDAAAQSQARAEQERLAIAEQARLAALEEARLKAEKLQQVQDQEVESLRRENEEIRLAAEREARRQADFLAAEEARLAEIAASQRESVEASEANSGAIKELKARLSREGAKSSDVQVSLMWNNYNDLDLHIVCPSGERIHGGNKISKCGGELDVDANVRAETRKPVENVFWPEGTAPSGQFQVYVHYYKKQKKRRSKDPTKFQVIVSSEGSDREYSAELSAGDPIMHVCSFSVSSSAEREQNKRELESQIEALSTKFQAADTDGSDQLSIEELAEAIGVTIEEATSLHRQADADGDGSVSLSEFLSSYKPKAGAPKHGPPSSVPSAPDLDSLIDE
ncbi:MAG: hypothetical protein CMA63_01520 [Euryarchaeota archaeon]|nr:hypothetical protein [Euryarchaeota archaeon]|tara:strand:+ start:30626 stop:31897 length:1272 start_codon:yes stop_codon:yes gene_type:complete